MSSYSYNALVVVDMQNDFIDGSLGSEEAKKIVPNVVQKVEEYYKRGDMILFTRDTHFKNYLSTSEGQKLPVPHCIRGTRGYEICDELKNTEAYSDCKTVILDKKTFGTTDILQSLHSMRSSDDMLLSIEICGLCTDICVISNALILKAQTVYTPIKVDSKCCAGVTSEKHEAALEVMRSCQIEVV